MTPTYPGDSKRTLSPGEINICRAFVTRSCDPVPIETTKSLGGACWIFCNSFNHPFNCGRPSYYVNGVKG